MKQAKNVSSLDSFESYIARKRAEDDRVSLQVYRRELTPVLRRRRMRILLIVLAVAAVAILTLAFLIRSIQDSRAYDRYIEEAQMSTLSGDYDSALSLLRKAAMIDPSDECLLMMAQ